MDEIDQYRILNKYNLRVSYRLEESDKEMQIREIENKLAAKYTPGVFKDSLEGLSIKMEPVYFIIDESIPESEYPKPETVSRNVPINYTKAAYDNIQKTYGKA